MRHVRDALNIETLVRRIGESGWTDETFEAFEVLLGTTIRRSLVVHAGKLQDTSWAPALLQRSRRAHVIEDTTSDLWIQLSTSLIPKYLDTVKTHTPEYGFAAYLSGVIRFLLIDNARQAGLLPHHTVGELVRRYRRARRQSTRCRIIAMLKGRCYRAVRNEILARCPQSCFHDTHKNIHRIVDHFFETYLPAAIQRPETETARSLREMIDQYVSSGMGGGRDYCSRICAIPQFQEVSLDGSDVEADELLSCALLRRGKLR
ncbi:hypothetical protein JW848_10485 [Candidatus Bipolaricaulota bacterium]|nr:hypothetical protein [Candidatus Bipolaricaulota bacterium]